jgi:hypothetical protein
MIKLLDILEIENNLKANRNIVRVKGTDVSPLNTGDPIDYNAFKRGYKSIKTTSDPDTGQITTEFETLPKFDEIRRILLKYRTEIQPFEFSKNEDVASLAKKIKTNMTKTSQMIFALDKMLELMKK